MMTVMIIVVLAVLGVILGSFVNALVWRLHEQAALVGKKGKATVERRQALSITKGRSMCPHCGHELAAKDLVPVASWLWLRGKCRYCRTSISWQYPLVELVAGGLFVASYLAWPLTFVGADLFVFGCWLVFVVGFVALTVYDLRWFTLPDRIVLPLVALAALQTCVAALWRGNWADLYAPLLGAVIIFGLFWTLYQVSGGRWIGGGDVKLALVLGLLAGTPARAFLVIFGASLLGTCAGLPALVRSKRGLHTRIPFGPYLLLATYLTVLYGAQIISWYRNLILP